MLDEEQRTLLFEGVKAVLPDFDQSGAAFTPSMVISAIQKSGRFANGRVPDEHDAKAFITDVVSQHMEALPGKRQIVLLEREPEPRWEVQDA